MGNLISSLSTTTSTTKSRSQETDISVSTSTSTQQHLSSGNSFPIDFPNPQTVDCRMCLAEFERSIGSAGGVPSIPVACPPVVINHKRGSGWARFHRCDIRTFVNINNPSYNGCCPIMASWSSNDMVGTVS